MKNFSLSRNRLFSAHLLIQPQPSSGYRAAPFESLLYNQRVLNTLWRTRLSRFRLIWLLPHYPPSFVSKLDRRHTGRLRKRDNLLARGGGWVSEEPNDWEKALSSINHSILSAYPSIIYQNCVCGTLGIQFTSCTQFSYNSVSMHINCHLLKWEENVQIFLRFSSLLMVLWS
jgi:hypothetical protein